MGCTEGPRANRRPSALSELLRFDAHTVEAAVYEEHRNDQEDTAQHAVEDLPLLDPERNRQLYRQQAEQGGELDDRVQCHRTGVLERIADRVAHYRGRV